MIKISLHSGNFSMFIFTPRYCWTLNFLISDVATRLPVKCAVLAENLIKKPTTDLCYGGITFELLWSCQTLLNSSMDYFKETERKRQACEKTNQVLFWNRLCKLLHAITQLFITSYGHVHVNCPDGPSRFWQQSLLMISSPPVIITPVYVCLSVCDVLVFIITLPCALLSKLF